VSEQRKRLERALQSCAERGAPADTVDLWPAVRKRVRDAPVSGERTSEASARSRTLRPSGGLPNISLALAFVVVSVLILGALVYVAAGPINGPAQHGPPPGKPHGSERGAGQTRGAPPEGRLPTLGTKVGQSRTADGERVTLDWAYADEKYVAVGLHTQRLAGAQKGVGADSGSGPSLLEPALWDDTVGDEAKLPPYVKITDASGQDFDLVGGGTGGGSANAVFDAPEGLQQGSRHRFRLEVPLSTAAGGTPGQKPAAGPFYFDFELSVRPAPTIEVNQKAEVKGITLTLERVVDSPANPQAVVCGVPVDAHRLMPWLEDQGGAHDELVSAPQKLGNGCWSLSMGHPVGEGRSSVTVARLEGVPEVPDRAEPRGRTFSVKPKTIRGSWSFEFETPGP
jgi:hypothetical protein